jgi:hypothetical protein
LPFFFSDFFFDFFFGCFFPLGVSFSQRSAISGWFACIHLRCFSDLNGIGLTRPSCYEAPFAPST